MDNTKEELAARLASLSDEDLVRRVAGGTLTPLADEVARAELASRGIEAPRAAEPPTEMAEEEAGDEAIGDAVVDDGVDLVTIARLNDVLKANVLRAHLESEGIFVHLWGEHLGVAHIIFSAATGGMRLQVRNDQVERAREILAAFERGEYALDEDDLPE